MPNGNIRTDARYVERDTERTIRHRNKGYYRVLHWPIWIFVFFIAPGPLTFDLFERGFDRRTFAWLAAVLCATAVAALRGHERRYFYGSVWAVTIAQPVRWAMWGVLPAPRAGDLAKLAMISRYPHVRRPPVAPRTPATHSADCTLGIGGF